ncbi:hypothetical protein [Kordia sp.]|uniref:hypothetical protein n=1 Tax=Kordia sp. TaxID=1965332 RepID=UPI003D2C16B6
MSFLLLSCSKKEFNTEAELLAHIQNESNEFLQQKAINGVEFLLLYRPTDLLVSQELVNNYEAEEIQELRNQYGKYLYFNLSMSYKNKELLSVVPKNRNEFGQMVNELAFGMNQKVYLFTKTKDTIEMVDFIYPRMYGMSNATTIMLVYPRNKEQLKEEFLNLTIKDLGTHTGEVKFKIPTGIINNQPRISF